MCILRDVRLNSITVFCFNHDLDEPTVKRHILGNKGKFEQENKSEVSLNLTSENLKLEFSFWGMTQKWSSCI